MHILLVTNDGRGQLAGQTTRAHGLSFSVAHFAFEQLVRFRRPPAAEPVVSRAALERAVDEIEAYEGIAAEAPESLLLHYVRHKRGLRPLRWIVIVVQLFERLAPLRAGIRRLYGDDPLAIMAADRRVRWLVTAGSHVEPLVAAGIPLGHIVVHPSTTAMQEAVVPGAAAAYTEPLERALSAALAGLEGGVLVAGTNNRDLDTAARAAELAGERIHVLSDPRRVPPVASSAVRYHDLVPLSDFVAAVARAGVMLVPLRAGDASCGQQTIAIAQRMRTLVVASDVPAVRDYLVDGESALLMPPEDPPALAAALRRARALGEVERRRLLDAGFARDARDGALVGEVLCDAFQRPID